MPQLLATLVAFAYVWSTHVCTGVAASFCLPSPDQRSAAQLSHLVRHRACSVLQQWCEVQAPLTTLDPPVWAACEPGAEWQGRAEKWQPTQGSRSQRAMKKVTGMEKTQAGWWRITRGEDNFSEQHWRLSCSLALTFCISLLHTWLCLLLPTLPLFWAPHFLSLSVLLALLLCLL